MAAPRPRRICGCSWPSAAHRPQALAEAAVAAGMPRDAVTYFASSADAAPAVSAALRPGDLVLVKGSRGTRCDVVADRIAQERG